MFYKVGDVLPNVKLPKEWEFWRISNNWDEILGSFISKNVKPLRLRKGVLYVKVPNSCWNNEIFYLEVKLIDKINQLLKECKVNKIKCVLKP